MKTKLVVATRASEAEFLTGTATGRSLAMFRPSSVELRLFPENKEGLPTIYNRVIRECIDDRAMLVFAHDDLHILDYFWRSRLAEGLRKFQILGLAGNLRRVPRQPSWAFVDEALTWDKRENLSGVVGHGNAFPPRVLSIYGQTRQRVKLLDGLLLCCDSDTLLSNDIFFDERFRYHFYDLDLCRQAEQKNVSCGTWDLAVIHESPGNFRSEEWRRSYADYLGKWIE